MYTYELEKYPDLQQGTQEWLEARAGILTASTIGKIITTKTLKYAQNETARTLLKTLTTERITDWIEPTYPTKDMQRGKLDEPIARQAYENYTLQKVTEYGFYKLTLKNKPDQPPAGIIGYSPDGLVADNGLIEIKSRRPKTQLDTLLADTVPEANMAQIQTGLYVTGRDWCDYISFCGGLPLYVKRVYPDPKWAQAIQTAVIEAEKQIQEYLNQYKQNTADSPIMDIPAHYYPEQEIEL